MLERRSRDGRQCGARFAPAALLLPDRKVALAPAPKEAPTPACRCGTAARAR